MCHPSEHGHVVLLQRLPPVSQAWLCPKNGGPCGRQFRDRHFSGPEIEATGPCVRCGSAEGLGCACQGPCPAERCALQCEAIVKGFRCDWGPWRMCPSPTRTPFGSAHEHGFCTAGTATALMKNFLFEAASQNFASAPSASRGFTLQKFWPAFGGDHRRTLGGGGLPAKPPPPRLPPSNTSLAPPPFHMRTCTAAMSMFLM